MSITRSEYDATVGATGIFQRKYNGMRPGDPANASLLRLACDENPLLRTVLGRDAYNAPEKNDLAKIETSKERKDLSFSADYRS